MADAFAKAGVASNISHHQRTVYWIKYLKLDAHEALLLVGILHDIERAFNGDWKAGSDDPKKLRRHQDLSAMEAEKFLRQEGAAEQLITEVMQLIKHHEEGGDADQSVLCDADCLAYFEEKALKKAKQFKGQGKAEEFKKKLKYYFSRITSPQARAIAQKWYNEAQEELNKSGPIISR